MMNDGHNEVGTRERKLIWDEENRLLAVDDNGFVSNNDAWHLSSGRREVDIQANISRLSEFTNQRSPPPVDTCGNRYSCGCYLGQWYSAGCGS